MLGCVLGARDARRACSCFKSWRNGARYGGWEPSGGPNAGRFPASAPLSVPREQTMRDVRAEKALLRSRLLDARAKSSAEERTSGGRLIRDAVLSLPELQMAGTVAVYYSVGAEPETRGLVYGLWKRGTYVVLPVLRPALAVDRAGHRLGRGGGSFDRALARVGPLVPLIALLYDDELVDRLPAEAHDVPVRAVVRPAHGVAALPAPA